VIENLDRCGRRRPLLPRQDTKIDREFTGECNDREAARDASVLRAQILAKRLLQSGQTIGQPQAGIIIDEFLNEQRSGVKIA